MRRGPLSFDVISTRESYKDQYLRNREEELVSRYCRESWLEAQTI